MNFGWKVFKDYYVKGQYDQNGLVIYITDLKSLWISTQTKSELVGLINKRLAQMTTTVEQVIPFLFKLFDSDVEITISDQKLLLFCKGLLGDLQFEWLFECLLTNEISEILVEPLVRLSLLFAAREQAYKDNIQKMKERMNTMQDMFDLHGIQSGLKPLDLCSVDWNGNVDLNDFKSILEPFTIASEKPVVKVEKVAVEGPGIEKGLEPNTPEKLNKAEKQKKRRELFTQKPVKKKRIF